MKRVYIISIIVAAMTALGVKAQEYLPQLKREIPNLQEIKREVNDRTSVYFYPRLMEEHLKNDTTMKVEKYRHLYLGSLFQEDYNPYRTTEIPEHVKAIYKKSKINSQEADSILKYADISLADNPLDLYQMLYKAEAYRVKHKTNLSKIWNNKVKYLVYAIMSTGNGRDERNAWWVITPQDEYFLAQYLGYMPVKHEFDSPSFEIITARDPYGYDARFYFNIASILDEYYRKWE